MRLNYFNTLFQKIIRSWRIVRYTNFSLFRPSQLKDKSVIFNINGQNIEIVGQSIWSMIEEIVIDDVYKIRTQANPKVMLDVGANVGIFALHAATLFPECRIYAFEPSYKNFMLLKKNTNGFKNIYCIQAAISDKDGIGYIQEGLDFTAFQVSLEHTSADAESCKVLSLDTFLKEASIRFVDILKLDCEGAEYDIVLNNLRSIEQVVGEYHVVENKKTENLKKSLEDKGFEIKKWDPFPLGNAGLFWAVNTSHSK